MAWYWWVAIGVGCVLAIGVLREVSFLKTLLRARLRKRSTMTPDNPVRTQSRILPFLDKAKKLLANKQYSDLNTLCIQILEKNSTVAEQYGFREGDHMAEVFSFRGVALQEVGDLEGAFESFSRAIARDCSHLSCYRERGLILVHLLAAGKHPSCCPFDLQQQAEKDFSTYLEHFPDRSDELALLILEAKEGVRRK
jgi:tetratricopeptide (TPR) repeat protein